MYFKEKIVEAGRRLANSNLTVETWGNISYLDESTGMVYMTPSGMPYDTITEDDIVVCWLDDGSLIEARRKPTIEKDLHLAIYRARKDVNAIVHTHAIYSTVYATMGRDIPIILDEAAQALGDVVKCAEYAYPGTPELGEKAVKALGEKAKACLVNSHGAVCVGSDLNDAFKVAAVLEMTAQVYSLIESTGGKPVGISPDAVAYMQEMIKHYGQGK